ncbi:MAG: hypothetical protein DHS20C15_30980 [Planctomycetota bacterium]|nr:MAG: hypothetical protein DHS20C15_30980 [Planctomycetota bacterium]
MSAAQEPAKPSPEDAELEALAKRLRTCLGASSASAQPAELALDDYVDLRVIQRGGQGVVYAARQLSTGRRVAIKQLHARGVGAERHRARFEREIEIASRLVHPNVVPVFDRGVTPEGDLFFVMEFIDGLPLDRFAEESALSVASRLELFDRLCAALAYAHRCGVVHRDLKPENVLVDDSGEPRVLDLGLAKPLAQPADESVTRAGEFLGTLAHASPEQLSGDPDEVDERTDVHGLGVLLYRLLAGRHPFPTDGSLNDLVRAINEHDPAPPTRGSRAPDRDLDALCLSCLAKRPADRYASVEALRTDLAAWRDGRPLQARAHHRGYVLRRTLQRHRALVAAVLLVIVGLSVATVTAWSALGDAQREARRAEHLSDFLVDTLAAAEPGLHPRNVTLVQWIERARLDAGASFPGEPLSEAAVRDAVGHVLRAAGSFDAAELEFTRALALLDEADRSSGRQAVATRLHQAQANYERGDWERANTQLERVAQELTGLRSDDERVLRERWLQVTAMLRLAQGQAARAVELLEQGMQGADERGDASAASLLLPVLADALRAAGDVEGSLRAHDEAVRVRTERFGATHPFVQRVVHNRALALAELGRYDEAQPALEQVSEQLTQALGEAHPVSLQARVSLAGLLKDRGAVDAARSEFSELVTACLEHLGPRHRTTLDAQHALGALLRRADELQASETQLRAALTGRALLFGDDAEPTLRTQVELALCLGRGSQLDAAESMLRAAVQAAQTSLGGHTDTTLDAEHSLAVLLLDTGRAEEAQALWADMTARADASFGEHDSRPGNYRLQRGLALARLGRLDQAAAVLEAAHARFEVAGPELAGKAAACAALLVQVHGARGDEQAQLRWTASP